MKRILCLVFLSLFLATSAFATTYPSATVIQFLLSQVRTSTTSLANGKVYFYLPGTTDTTGVYIWLDKDASQSASNPYTLDANGTAQLYAAGSFRVIIKDSAGVTRFDRDNLFFDNPNTLYTLNSLIALIKTSSYTMLSTDVGGYILFNSASALNYNLLAATTAGSGFYVRVKNIGAGALTLVGTVDGGASRTLSQYDEAILYSNGTNWYGTFLPHFAASQTGSDRYAVDSGTVNAYAVAYNQPLSTLSTGMVVQVKITNKNTSATPTLAVNGGTPTTIIRNDTGGAVVAGDLQASGYYFFQYDGTNFRVLNPYFPSLTMSKARIFLNSAQSIGNSPTKVLLDTVSFDTDSIADVLTDHRIVPTKAGYYKIVGCVEYVTAAAYVSAWLYVNGSAVTSTVFYTAGGANPSISACPSDLLYFNGSTDYLELYSQDSAGSSALVTGSSVTYLSIIGPY